MVGASETLVLDAFPGAEGPLPAIKLEAQATRARDLVLAGGAVGAISAISYVDAAGAVQQLAASAYTASLLEQPAHVSPIGAWPAAADRAGAVTIAYIVSPLPADDFAIVIQAMLLLCGHWYRNREAVAGGGAPAELPLAVTWLLQPLRQWPTE